MQNAFMSEIQAIRESLGMSQAKFAKFVGFNQGTVSRWESGKLVINDTVLVGIRAKAASVLAARKSAA
jgi:DNA-binding transcriptional regulator YiaG